MNALRMLNHGTAKVCEVIMTIFSIVMVIACFAQVVTRAIGTPLSWSEELARYLAVWLTFIGAAYALHKRGLATVEIMFNALKGIPQKILFLFISAVVLAFCVVMIVFGFDFALGFMNQTSPAMQIPKGAVYLSIPISGILMILYQAELMGEYFFGKEDK